MSEIKVDKISPQSGTALAVGDSGDTITIPSGATITNSGTATGFGGGKILQCVSITKTDQQSTSTTGTFAVVEFGSSPYGLAITPTATSSKIFVTLGLALSAYGRYTMCQLFRDATQVGMGDTSGSRTRVFLSDAHSNESVTSLTQTYLMGNMSMSFMDEPNTTSEIKYYVKCGTGIGYSASTPFHINRTHQLYAHAQDAVGISTLTLFEIGA